MSIHGTHARALIYVFAALGLAGCASKPPLRYLDRMQMHDGEWMMIPEPGSLGIVRKGFVTVRMEEQLTLRSLDFEVRNLSVCGQQVIDGDRKSEIQGPAAVRKCPAQVEPTCGDLRDDIHSETEVNPFHLLGFLQRPEGLLCVVVNFNADRDQPLNDELSIRFVKSGDNLWLTGGGPGGAKGTPRPLSVVMPIAAK